MMHRGRHFHRPYRLVFSGVFFFCALFAASGALASNRAFSQAETFDRALPVRLDALESVLDQAGNAPLEEKTRASAGGTTIGPQTGRDRPADTGPAARIDGIDPSLKIRVTPVLATPIPSAARSADASPLGGASRDDPATLSIRIVILIVSVSTFLLSGALLARRKYGRSPGVDEEK